MFIERESELAYVHLFDLQICFVGVFPTRQDLDDNVKMISAQLRAIMAKIKLPEKPRGILLF